MLVIATVLLVAGLIANSLYATVLKAFSLRSIFTNALPFLAIFIAILLYYISLIVVLSRALSGVIPERIYRPIFTVCVVGIVLGIFMMFQPWALVIYQVGFDVLLFSLLGFMIVSHITPRPPTLDEMG